MTKKLLLSAGAIAALAFAGAATAGDLTDGTISGVTVRGAYENTAAKVYNLANERDFTTALSTNDSGLLKNSFTFGNLTNEIQVPANTSGLTFIATYTLTGDAKFANVSGAVIELGGLAGSVTPILSDGGKTLTAYVVLSNDANNSVTIDSVELTKFDLTLASKGDVSVAYSLKQVIAGQNIELDASASATQIIGTKSVFDKYFAFTAGSVFAKLPDFNTFNEETAVNVNVAPGGVAATTWNSLSTTLNTAGVYTDLQGSALADLDVGDIIESAEFTLTGPQVEALQASIGGVGLPEDATATSAVYDLDGDALDARLTLTPGEDVRMTGGEYKVVIQPTFQNGWSGVSSVERSLMTVNLEGTNFYAPWFGFGGQASNATLRIGNNSGNDTGPIVIELKANNGTATTNTTATFPGVEAGRFVSITGAQLRSAFGTNAANGDLLVSIQSDAYGDNISAKVRTVQTNGNTFESSLDVLRPTPVDPTTLQNSLASISSQLSSVQSTADTIDGAVAGVNTNVIQINGTVSNISGDVQDLSTAVTDIGNDVNNLGVQLFSVGNVVSDVAETVNAIEQTVTEINNNTSPQP